MPFSLLKCDVMYFMAILSFSKTLLQRILKITAIIAFHETLISNQFYFGIEGFWPCWEDNIFTSIKTSFILFQRIYLIIEKSQYSRMILDDYASHNLHFHLPQDRIALRSLDLSKI